MRRISRLRHFLRLQSEMSIASVSFAMTIPNPKALGRRCFSFQIQMEHTGPSKCIASHSAGVVDTGFWRKPPVSRGNPEHVISKFCPILTQNLRSWLGCLRGVSEPVLLSTGKLSARIICRNTGYWLIPAFLKLSPTHSRLSEGC